jgi:hypothetical protein
MFYGSSCISGTVVMFSPLSDYLSKTRYEDPTNILMSSSLDCLNVNGSSCISDNVICFLHCHNIRARNYHEDLKNILAKCAALQA